MTHHHLRLQLLHSFKRYAYDNDHRGSAHHQTVHTGQVAVDDRDKRHEREEQGADERNLGKDLCDEVRRGFAGTDTRDGAVALAEIIGHFQRIILNRHIEICKHDDQQEIEQSIEPAGLGEGVEEALPEAACGIDKKLNELGNG